MSQPNNADLTKYAESPIFTGETVPQKLLDLHDTKAGVWGKIVVIEGAIEYCIPELNRVEMLTSDRAGWIEPQQVHHVSLCGPVCFKVEFYRASRGD